MARPLRVEFEGAIDHGKSRRNADQDIVEGNADWIGVPDRLAQTVERLGDLCWGQVLCSVPDREMAAWLCRRWTEATLSQLGPTFRLTGTDSVFSLVRRAKRRHHQSAGWRKTVQEVEASLGLNTEHKA